MPVSNYECIFIIRPDLDDETIAAKIEKINNFFVSKAVQIQEVETWGRRILSTEFEHFKDGFYVLFYLSADHNVIKDLDEFLRMSEDVIRHLIVKSGPHVKKEAVPTTSEQKTPEA